MNNETKPKRPSALVARLGIAGIALAATLGIAACGSDDGGDGGGGKLDLVAYSTPQQAYEEKVIPAFQDSSGGKGVEVSTSFGSSGDQARAVEEGLPADVVALSLEPDIQKLIDAGIVGADWNKDDTKGIVTDSVVVIMTRPGNPKGVKSFEDLASGDVEVIQPNPATSGGAKWNIMAEYGSQVLGKGATDQEGLDFVKKILENTTVQDDSARDSLQTFDGGKGDVLVGYENEAIQAKEEGIELDYVVPDDTILIENPIAVTKDADAKAQSFVDFTRTDEAQALYAEAGYRPVVESVLAENKDQFPEPPGLFTIADFGGWSKVNTEFFDDETGSIFEIQRELGNPTE